MQATETTYRELESLYQSRFKNEVKSKEPLSSHGSDRMIFRLKDSGGRSVIGITNKHTEENKAFIGFTRHFRTFNLSVPEIYSVSDDKRAYLLQDLGDLTLFKRISGNFGEEGIALYKQAISELLKFQITAGRSIDYSLCYQFDEFGEENIDYDLRYFTGRFLKAFYKEELDFEKLTDEFNQIKKTLLELPREFFLYRDFQSRNIMINNGELYFIDYQSGRKGALHYDLASLLYDARANLPQAARESLIDFYIEEAKKYADINEKDFKHYFWFFALVRILQALGAYGFLGVEKGKKEFLESIPYALNNINFILNHKIHISELEYLRNIFTNYIYGPQT